MASIFRKPWPDGISLLTTQTFSEHNLARIENGWKNYNGGLDVAPYWGKASMEIPILAARDGTIEYVTMGDTGYGNHVRLRHDLGYETLYAHLDRVSVRSGSVKAGDVLGTMGNTGNSTGKHLHFEVRLNGTPVDPVPLFAREEPALEPRDIPAFPSMVRAEVLASMLNIRSGPGTEHRKIGELRKGDVVDVISVVQGNPYLWLKIGWNQYCAHSRVGEQLCKWRSDGADN